MEFWVTRNQEGNIPLDWALGAFILQSTSGLELEHADWGWVWIARLAFGFFFFFYTFVRLRLLFMYCSINNSCKVWLFYFFQPISAHRALFMDPQISLFSNFFIKNGFHGTIYTFKNYFATIFFSFQFSALSKLP